MSPEGEIVAAYGAAMTAAFQVLVLTLQNNGALETGEFQRALLTYMEGSKNHTGNEVMLALLDDLRNSLLE